MNILTLQVERLSTPVQRELASTKLTYCELLMKIMKIDMDEKYEQKVRDQQKGSLLLVSKTVQLWHMIK